MKRFLLFVLSLAALVGPAAAAPRPVLVEFFTAQGCASCAQAEALAGPMADRPGIILLTWSVDYWDYLGWKDTFARPEFTQRQRAYDRRFGQRNVHTPQLIVDGRDQIGGDKAEEVEALIARAAEVQRTAPSLKRTAQGGLTVGRGRAPGRNAEVWLIRYDPKAQSVDVKAGDNRGAAVVQRNVVRQLVRLGVWNGRARSFVLPAATDDSLMSLVLVQGARGGPILAARVLKLAKPIA